MKRVAMTVLSLAILVMHTGCATRHEGRSEGSGFYGSIGVGRTL